MASGSITSWQIEEEKVEVVTDFLFLGSKIIDADGNCSHEIRRQLLLNRKAKTNLDSVLKSRDITLPTKVYIVKSDLPSGHVRLWEMDCKEGRAPKNWCLWTLVLEKTPENPLDSKEIRSVNLKGNKPWILVGRTDVQAEALILWLSDANSWLTGKVSDTGKDWWRKEKRVSEDKWLDGITDAMDMNLGKLRETARDRNS